MALKYKLSPKGMVLYTLATNAGAYFSVKQIKEKILKNFDYHIKEETIVKAIDEGDRVIGNIDERTERRGALNLPVKVFTVINHTIDN